MQTRPVAALIALSVTALLCTAAANAACREELQQFERKLNDSSLAVDEPDTFEDLAREAEAAAELRDEELCLQQVAELNAALPTENPAPPVSTTSTQTKSDTGKRAPPAPPVLLEAAPVDFDVDSEEQSDDLPPREAGADDNS